MQAAILAVGNELLAPGRVETNSVFLTDELAAQGIPVGLRAVIPDNKLAIANAIVYALERVDIVLLSGGLGPTSDDITRDGVATALSLEMELDDTILEEIRERFRKRVVPMPEVNRKQAMVLNGAEVLPNNRGTAPGQWISVSSKKVVVLLPGPPRELKPMFRKEVAHRLSSSLPQIVYDVKKLWVTGLPESVVEERTFKIYSKHTNPSTTILASPGQVEIRLTAKGNSTIEAQRVNESLAGEIREALGESVFSDVQEKMEVVVGGLLLSARKRLSVAESLTGGLVADRLTSVPGSSQYFDAGFVTYSNQSKTAILGVSKSMIERSGAVSMEAALAMAKGARELTGSHLAISTTGIAGPGGGSVEKPVGLVYIAVDSSTRNRVERFTFPEGRLQIKKFAAQAALNMIRIELMDVD